jgi:uncharacterized protein YceK
MNGENTERILMMGTVLLAVTVVFLLMSGCATVNPEMAQHMAGVASALDKLPTAPVGADTQAQISGWSAWASYLLKAASGL